MNLKEINYLEKYLDKTKLPRALKRLKNGEPVQYIVGNVDFFGFQLKVTADVLIPRFETEELVEKTVKYIKGNFNENLDIIDLGTGSGCIAIALKKLLPKCNITAIDISKKALSIAKKNAVLNKVDIQFYQSDMLDNVEHQYDIIISNPPYIAYDESVMEVVKNNEPHLALYAEDNGLYFYNKILSQAHKNIKNKALIAFEIGETQGQAINMIAKNYFPNSLVKIEKDLQKRDRFVFIFVENNEK